MNFQIKASDITLYKNAESEQKNLHNMIFVYLLNFFEKAIDFDGLKGYNPNINSEPIGSCLQLNALSRK